MNILVTSGPLPGEEWRPAYDLPFYEVSNFGRIRNIHGRLRKLKTDKRGYVFLGVQVGPQSTNVHVARIVCATFNGPPPVGFDVDHKNRVRGDNVPANLHWVTRAENLQNRVNQHGSAHKNAKLTEGMVMHIRVSSLNSRELAEIFGVSPRTIRDAKNGKLWRHVDV